jgi:hypothetical protein
MTFLLLIFGVILFIVGYKGTQTDLANQLGQDVPGFFAWAGAIVGLSMIGYLPGLKDISRAMLGLVALVVFLKGYSQMIAGFQAAFSATGSTASAAPAQPLQEFASEVKSSGFTTGVSTQDQFASASGSSTTPSDGSSSLASAAGSVFGAGGGTIATGLTQVASSAGLGSIVNSASTAFASVNATAAALQNVVKSAAPILHAGDTGGFAHA